MCLAPAAPAPGAHPARSTHSLPGLSFVGLTTQETRLHQSRQWHNLILDTKLPFITIFEFKKGGWWEFFLQYSAHFRLYKWRIFCDFLIIRYFKQCSSSLLRVLSISKGVFFVNTSYWWDKCTCKLNKFINKHFKFQCGSFFPHAFLCFIDLTQSHSTGPSRWQRKKVLMYIYIYKIHMCMIHIHVYKYK